MYIINGSNLILKLQTLEYSYEHFNNSNLFDI